MTGKARLMSTTFEEIGAPKASAKEAEDVQAVEHLKSA
jgi:hypothetical protein